MYVDDRELCWRQDSNGVSTCHVINGGQDSLVGTLMFKKSWIVTLNNGIELSPKDGCSSYVDAKFLLESHFRNEKIFIARTTPRNAQQGKV